MNTLEAPSKSQSTGSGLANPVFVVGVFRSGTSLLYSLLNQHPQMAFMYECDAWNFPGIFSRARFKGNWLERQEFYNQALSRHRLIFGRSLQGLENVRKPEDLYQAFGDGKGAALWGEKSPFYCSRLRQLAQRSPGSSFVLIWRDPVEVYRSVLLAGQKTRFFRRPGMLSRLIVYQEKMIHQAAELERAGIRVHHVTYAGLIDRTAEVCQGVCRFLGVPFDSQMLDLSRADMSAVYHAPQHDHLRRGIIERQPVSDEVLEPRIVRKLERFRNRWSRVNGAWFPQAKPAGAAPEPAIFERCLHWLVGSLLCAWDDTKRLLFEFMPLAWLRTYRETARWLVAGRDAAPQRSSWREQIAAHWITIIVSYALIAGLAMLHAVTDPRFTFLPFYLVPCSVLALVINRRWGTCAALVSSFIGPALLSKVDSDFARPGVFIWNSVMRFFLLQVVVMLLDRVRIEIASGSGTDET